MQPGREQDEEPGDGLRERQSQKDECGEGAAAGHAGTHEGVLRGGRGVPQVYRISIGPSRIALDPPFGGR